MREQAAVLPDAVVARELAGVALVLVDVVDALAGLEAEVLVGGASSGPQDCPNA